MPSKITISIYIDVVEVVQKATQVGMTVDTYNSTQARVEVVLFETAKTTSSKSRIWCL